MRYEEVERITLALHHINEAKKRIPKVDMETTYELNRAERELMECLLEDTREDIEMYEEQFQ